MSKNKRMFYVWDENIEFYDSLAKDKKASGLLNKALLEAQNKEPDPITPGQPLTLESIEVPEDFPGHDHPDPRMVSVHRDIWLKEERDRRLQANRKV
jgi:hypothetical protein